ncbi:MAG: TIGR03560 family F420-dependent LLM class oxidoreductase [Candidatus Binatales bacterium]
MANKVEFGLEVPQGGLPWPMCLEFAQAADRLGYHSIWLSDHMWIPGLPDLDYHEAIAMMGALAACTQRVRLGTIVLCNSYRNPGLLAKSLVTIDHISNGRLEFGIGAGWMEEEYRAYGYEFPPAGVRLKQFEEGLLIIKALFAERRASFKGKYYSITDAPLNPKPIQQPHPPIMIGGLGEKVLLRLVAKYADHYNLMPTYENFDRTLGALKEHCRALGRDFNTLKISEMVFAVLGATEQEAAQAWAQAQSMGQDLRNAIKGTPKQVIEQFKQRAARGVSLFQLVLLPMPFVSAAELFAREVMPAFA